MNATAPRVPGHGGTALAPRALADGWRVVACENPQGGAFGVIERG
jgi:predicted enzyme related to lactoylglutathione lyase